MNKSICAFFIILNEIVCPIKPSSISRIVARIVTKKYKNIKFNNLFKFDSPIISIIFPNNKGLILPIEVPINIKITIKQIYLIFCLIYLLKNHISLIFSNLDIMPP